MICDSFYLLISLIFSLLTKLSSVLSIYQLENLMNEKIVSVFVFLLTFFCKHCSMFSPGSYMERIDAVLYIGAIGVFFFFWCVVDWNRWSGFVILIGPPSLVLSTSCEMLLSSVDLFLLVIKLTFIAWDFKFKFLFKWKIK